MIFRPLPVVGPSIVHRPSSIVGVLLVAYCLLLTGCDLFGSSAPTTPSPIVVLPTPTRPARPQGGALTVRLASDVSTLNPWLSGRDEAAASVTGMIFGGLTKLDNHLQPQPDLAYNWEASPDGTALTFHLRDDVVWHDGAPFTAQDVVWSYETLAQLPADTPSLLHIQDTVASVTAIDPVTYTVRFELRRRYSPILADLALPILPSHILSGTTPDQLASNSFNSAPIGTGPFAFDKREAGQSVELRSHVPYYGGQPPIDEVDFLVAPDEKVAEAAVQDGTLMLAQLLPAAAERLVAAGGGVKGGAYDEPGFDFVAFNLRPTSVFSDTRLRQAWALALDKQGLAFAAAGGEADPVWSDVPKASWAYNPNVVQLGGKPDEAKKLLTDAGWADTNGDGVVDKGGKPLEVTLYVRSDDAMRRKAADNISEQLARVGMKINVQAADFSTALLARLSPNANPPFDFDVVLLGWTRLGFDPDPFALFHSSQTPTQAEPGLLNFTGFQSPEYDALTIEARSTYDYNERKQKYARTQEIISDQLPYYFLWAKKYGVVAGPKLQGDIDFASPRFLWNVDQWWIE